MGYVGRAVRAAVGGQAVLKQEKNICVSPKARVQTWLNKIKRVELRFNLIILCVVAA